MTLLEYNKLILEKMTFERRIFKKELKKAFRNSTKEEIEKLKCWCRQKFGKNLEHLAY